jgi:hypothetical protein
LIESSSIGPSRYDENYNVATLTFSEELPCLIGKPKGIYRLKDLNDCKDPRASSIQLDQHFEGLTPLNYVDEAEACAEYVHTLHSYKDFLLKSNRIIAITGLGGKPFASWQGSDGSMWLRDHLPLDVKGLKVSIWGCQSSLENSTSEAGLEDYTENFLEDLRISRRRREMKRLPLILVGHSMGGVIAKSVSVFSICG